MLSKWRYDDHHNCLKVPATQVWIEKMKKYHLMATYEKDGQVAYLQYLVPRADTMLIMAGEVYGEKSG